MVFGDMRNAEGTGRRAPSIFDVGPEELGGPNARRGFAFQDDVAARFFIQMLSDTTLSEVSCETYDDILLLWQLDGAKVAEFVQVKAEHPNQLWSVARLCERKKSSDKPDGSGTSILEKSLARDRYAETAWFRIISSRQIGRDLELLTRERGHEHRSMSYGPFMELVDSVRHHVDNFRSENANDVTYWLLHTCWSVVQERDIVDLNLKLLTDGLHSLDLLYDPDTLRGVYENLRALAKQTAEYGIDRWREKRISRDHLLVMVKGWLAPDPDVRKIQRLEQKLTDAGLDQVCLRVAEDQRSLYLRRRRTPGYLDIEQADDTDQQVLDTLHNLRSSLDSGEIEADGIKFHDRCLKEVQKLGSYNAGGSSRLLPGYLAGCMYEITARCRHRFKRIHL